MKGYFHSSSKDKKDRTVLCSFHSLTSKDKKIRTVLCSFHPQYYDTGINNEDASIHVFLNQATMTLLL